MGIIADLLLVGARKGAKQTARNTAQANRLARRHHKEITAQNAELIKIQRDALHYERYRTEPAYRQQTDQFWAQRNADQAVMLEAKRTRRNRVWRCGPFLLLGFVIGLFCLVVWLPQLGVGRLRGREPRFTGRGGLTRAWGAVGAWHPAGRSGDAEIRPSPPEG